MLIRAGYEMAFEADLATPMLAALSVHPSRNRDLRSVQRITTVPEVPLYDYMDGFGNVCTRLTMPAGGITLSCSFTIEDAFLPDVVATDALAVPVSDLPDEIMVYLLGSRYCETDRLVDIAWPLFSRITPGWAQVQAIVAYTHQRIAFGYEHARPTKTAFDAWQEQTGVCRDYAHLAIALCRCMNIPARYCTGYLGDMDLPAVVGEMDFSAWFEVFLAGRWYTFDARHNTPRAGRILMARGRDAADAALVTTFGLAKLSRFQVHTHEEASDRTFLLPARTWT
ncbi:transglutaminase-like domain-containing protein [Novosphingobium rosa]|uniref:transglutaminase-like domain-containing protein n=1 Tax=Novosphingobium rosa TaxID=76978 RepID=UPI00082A584F|nr:transglutaminase family protein [Novosphingobium rosa]